MARIAGVDLPREKRIEIGLTYVYGIGRPTATKLLAEAGVNPDTRVRDITDDEVKRAYREMAKKNHPDLVSNLGDEVRQAAEKKFQEINAAYETIKKQRGL